MKVKYADGEHERLGNYILMTYSVVSYRFVVKAISFILGFKIQQFSELDFFWSMLVV